MAYVPKSSTQASICFDCEKSCGKCSWSEYDVDTAHTRFKVPEGATAIPIYDAKGRFYTYRIVECPLFEKTPPRQNTAGTMTSSDEERFLDDPLEYLKRYER